MHVCWEESVIKQFLRWWKRSLLLSFLGAIFKGSFKHFRRRFNDKREDLPVKSLTLILTNWLSQRHKMNELWGMTVEGLSSPRIKRRCKLVVRGISDNEVLGWSP